MSEQKRPMERIDRLIFELEIAVGQWEVEPSEENAALKEMARQRLRNEIMNTALERR